MHRLHVAYLRWAVLEVLTGIFATNFVIWKVLQHELLFEKSRPKELSLSLSANKTIAMKRFRKFRGSKNMLPFLVETDEKNIFKIKNR